MQYEVENGVVVIRVKLSSPEFYMLNLIEAQDQTRIEARVRECLVALIATFRGEAAKPGVAPAEPRDAGRRD